MTLAQQLGAADVADLLEPEQFPPPPWEGSSNAPPSIIDTLRACEPSRELLGFVSREATAATLAGRIGDAAALLTFALCLKAALAPPAAMEDPPCSPL